MPNFNAKTAMFAVFFSPVLMNCRDAWRNCAYSNGTNRLRKTGYLLSSRRASRSCAIACATGAGAVHCGASDEDGPGGQFLVSSGGQFFMSPDTKVNSSCREGVNPERSRPAARLPVGGTFEEVGPRARM
jgi:hypothetical protein